MTPEELRKRAVELYDERCRLAHLYYRLDLPTLRRVNEIVARLSDDALREVVAYAEGLAMWGQPDSSSADASIPHGSSPDTATGA